MENEMVVNYDGVKSIDEMIEEGVIKDDGGIRIITPINSIACPLSFKLYIGQCVFEDSIIKINKAPIKQGYTITSETSSEDNCYFVVRISYASDNMFACGYTDINNSLQYAKSIERFLGFISKDNSSMNLEESGIQYIFASNKYICAKKLNGLKMINPDCIMQRSGAVPLALGIDPLGFGTIMLS